jgi:hypothetical protein
VPARRALLRAARRHQRIVARETSSGDPGRTTEVAAWDDCPRFSADLHITNEMMSTVEEKYPGTEFVLHGVPDVNGQYSEIVRRKWAGLQRTRRLNGSCHLPHGARVRGCAAWLNKPRLDSPSWPRPAISRTRIRPGGTSHQLVPFGIIPPVQVGGAERVLGLYVTSWPVAMPRSLPVIYRVAIAQTWRAAATTCHRHQLSWIRKDR